MSDRLRNWALIWGVGLVAALSPIAAAVVGDPLRQVDPWVWEWLPSVVLALALCGIVLSVAWYTRQHWRGR
jgi:hypothetical protein